VAQADPTPVRFASWVGYDMDGRTDIGWQTCIRYRLEEKAERLASYAALLEEIAPDIAEKLAAAGAHSQAMAALFAGDMTNPAP
jgi:phosphoenolpyruvate carboxylase